MDTCSTKGCRIFERLISIHLIEERDEEWDDIGHYFWRWTYPMIETETRKFIEKRLHSRFVHFSTNSSDHHAEDFIYYNNDSKWIYICCNSLSSGRFVLVLLTTDFYPNVYKEFLSLFAQLYQQKISPKKLLNYYLTLMIEEQVVISELANLKYTLANSASPKSGECQIKPIIKLFHLDVILIFTALLLKRKIAVYHHNQSILYDFVSALPLFVPHRPECQHKVLVPNVDIYCLDQINDLKKRSYYIATFQDSKIEESEDLYDIYINLAAIEITIAHSSRDVFLMTKTHKDVAMTLVRVAENENSTDEDIICEVKRKTSELRNTLFLMANGGGQTNGSISDTGDCNKISKSQLKQKLSSPNLEVFYWNLALAEGIADTEFEDAE